MADTKGSSSRITDKTKASKKNLTKTIEQQIQLFDQQVLKGASGLFPALSTGARTFITVNNLPLALCLDFSYSISADHEEVRTIDSHLPYDVNIGQVKISGRLTKIVNPDSSMEAEGLFHTMQSILHQPIVEMLVQDANGNTQFFCKGMFVSMESRVAMGQLTVASASFVGIQYQNWVYQEFKPYDEALGGINKALGKFKKALSGTGF